MRRQGLLYGLVVASCCAPFFADELCAQTADRAQDEQAIRAAAKGYLEALGRGDARALAGYWTADGDVVDELGQSHPASELLKQLAPPEPGAARPEIKMHESKIRFFSDEVAIEDGTSEVTASDGRVGAKGRFSAVWVKQNGGWRLASLREARIPNVDRPARLADLDWLVGQWSAESGDTKLEVSVRWNANETFLLRDLKVAREQKTIFHGSQRVGWDPRTGQLKAWNFDSDGGYGEGAWTRDGESWVIRMAGVLPDGRPNLTTTVVTPEGPDHFRLSSTRSPGAGAAEGTMQIEFTRVKASQ
jgi:uncharacterized protein (TIGR02246 family)